LLIVSSLLLEELGEVLAREKFRRYVDLDTVRRYLDLLSRIALVVPDPPHPPPLRSADPDDDYLIALAHDQSAVLISGDSGLLDVSGGAAIGAPSGFAQTLR